MGLHKHLWWIKKNQLVHNTYKSACQCYFPLWYTFQHLLWPSKKLCSLPVTILLVLVHVVFCAEECPTGACKRFFAWNVQNVVILIHTNQKWMFSFICKPALKTQHKRQYLRFLSKNNKNNEHHSYTLNLPSACIIAMCVRRVAASLYIRLQVGQGRGSWKANLRWYCSADNKILLY